MYINIRKNELKSMHPECLILFRVNDDYALIGDDTQAAQELLGIAPKTLGSEQLRIASFPHHALDIYLPRLIRAGHRVAICDLFQPKFDRENRVFTWGTASTLKRYRELCDQHPDSRQYGVFFAFGDKQMAEGVKSLINRGYIAEGEQSKICSCRSGLYGLPSEVERFLGFYRERRKRIAEECDPYEVYCYEYNNHECGISTDGDLEAIDLVISYWGADVARTIRRDSAQYSIESLNAIKTQRQ